MTFNDFKLHQDLAEGIGYMGFKNPTPIQEEAIPVIQEGRDLIACAQTGTGKTAAYLLPVLDKIAKQGGSHFNTLIIAPTRELAIQIDQQVQAFAYFASAGSFPVYGGGDGSDFERQKRALTKHTEIIVATPGKLLSHLNLGYIDTSGLQHLILDEADRMLDMGFYEDIMRIVRKLPEKRQTLLFSATMPPKIRELSKRILDKPAEISIAISKPAEGILQAAYLTYPNQKIPLIKHLLEGKEEKYPAVIIFSSTKNAVNDIVRDLKRNNFNAVGISSDLEQGEREEVMRKFRARKVQIVVATDVLSRGIDIEDISLVINYDVPNDPEDYIHRIGRTARAASTGVGLTFIGTDDQHKFGRIEQLIGKEIMKAPNPPDIGKGPDYDPKARPKGGGRGGHKGGGRKGGGQHRSSGNRR